MKKKSLLLIPFILILVNGCNLNQYKHNNIKDFNYLISYDKKVPEDIKRKTNSIFKPKLDKNLENPYKIDIRNYEFKKYSLYAGQALNSLEIETKSSIDVNFDLNNKKITKSLTSTKRFNSNELNPMAEQAMLDFIENEAIDDLINQLILEVTLIDM